MSSQLPDYYYCSRIDLQCSLLIDRHSTQLQLALHYISTSCSHNSIPLYLNLHYSKDSIKDRFFKEGILNVVENCTFAEPQKIIKDTFKDVCSAWKSPKTNDANKRKQMRRFSEAISSSGGSRTLHSGPHTPLPPLPQDMKKLPQDMEKLVFVQTTAHRAQIWEAPTYQNGWGSNPHVMCFV